MDYSVKEIQFLRITNIIFELCHVFLALFIVHNIHKYVIGLKMKQPLIWVFYILQLAYTIINIIDTAYSIRNPAKT